MSRRNHTYYFGRLNLLNTDPDKHDFLKSALTSDITVPNRKHKYGFFEVREIESLGELFAFGRLVKYKPQLEEEVVDERDHKIVSSDLSHGVVAKSEFFLHYRSSILAYRPNGQRISNNLFL